MRVWRSSLPLAVRTNAIVAFFYSYLNIFHFFNMLINIKYDNVYIAIYQYYLLRIILSVTSASKHYLAVILVIRIISGSYIWPDMSY